MGILRTLLAISVVFAHIPYPFLVGGRYAVQIFYLISGFLISYVLVERKSYSSARRFYLNRYLRLFPVYALVALLTLLVWLSFGFLGQEAPFLNVYKEAPGSAQLLLVFSNLTIFFQDWVMFCGVDKHRLVFSTNFLKSEVVLWPGLLVPQAWTLGVELTFYLCAPFILFKRNLLYLLFALSCLVRVSIFSLGLGFQDPWTYRFFPAELALFLLGTFSHQLLLPFYRRLISPQKTQVVCTLATLFLCFFTMFFLTMPLREMIKAPLLFIFFFFLLPFAFIFQSRHSWDQWIGDLSYPIYISHSLVFLLGHLSFEKLGADKSLFNLACLVGTGFVAYLLKTFVADPFESFRNRFRNSLFIPTQL